ncbi:NADH-quinone oxidoreductase subunit F [Flavobacterium suaedae]|uniref:NADH-quinone oxidoreductase subunit F n=1 Tax=Flavobacterium suaedae TaxID=1767027 RepID=A0ABQ1JWR0_9FLAO|nr:NADH-quinone oxidoreductase subunit NuoF [Flavobacterium suaedae]GGB79504.1 NADH-quinone oxidoreductase subunit F [Flavobacterium suaedae]
MGRKILLEHANVPGIKSYEVYRKMGGYASVEKALKSMTPDEVVEQVKTSGLRGRGGAGFPTGLKWSFIDKKSGNPRHLVCNADESEPGTFKDRYLMEYIPHLLIEGMITSSYALGCNLSYIYIRGEYMWVFRILEQAIKEAYANGWLGKNIMGTGWDLDLYVHCGAGAYICGEETALIESLEGKRGNPRIKPPFPAVKGLWQEPTVVNNVESIAAVPWIVNNGGEEYAKIGIGRSTGTKLISASGHCKNPGVYEIELGLSVDEFMNSDEYLGGMMDDRPLKALVPGGSSVPILPANLIFKTTEGNDRLMTYESLSEGGFESGSMLGSGGFIVYNDTSCIVRNTWNFSRFYHHESCGQCSPCREGTGWLEKVLHRIETGEGREEDIELLWDIQRKIEGNTICPLGDAAAWPVAAAIRHFREEFEYHVRFPEKIKNRDHYVNEPFEKVRHLVTKQTV